jgi:2,3-dihydroxybiphenyl 1,2-dioxygenase
MTISVKQLGYVGLYVSNIEAWKTYATDVLGMEIKDTGEDGRVYLRMDAFHHRVILHEDPRDDLAYAAWEVSGPRELDAVSAQLEKVGATVEEVDAAEATEILLVAECRRFTDCEGLGGEIYYGPVLTDEMKVPRAIRRRYLTDDLGMGHMSLAISDVNEFVHFYSDGLGLRISGMRRKAERAPGAFAGLALRGSTAVATLTCNRRHHSISVVTHDAPKRLQHLGLELALLDDVGIVLDKADELGLVTISLGRHQGDNILSFYMQTPSGFAVEYGWGGRLLGDDPRVEQFQGGPDIWGHKPVPRPLAG